MYMNKDNFKKLISPIPSEWKEKVQKRKDMNDKTSLIETINNKRKAIKERTAKYAELYKKARLEATKQNGVPEGEKDTFALGWMTGYLAHKNEQTP